MVSRDRGQLILVGAVAIALILLGLVLIVNTALFTQVVGSEGTVDATATGGVSSHELGDALAAVVAAENRDHDDVDDVDSALTGSSGEVVESAMINRTLERSGAIVSVDYSNYVQEGSRIAQDIPDDFTHPSSTTSPWSPIPFSERSELGRFVVTVHTDRGAGGNVSIDVTNTDSHTTEEIVLEVESGSVTVYVGGREVCSESSPDDTVRVDLYNGHVDESPECQFDLIESQSDPYEVQFSGDLTNVEGTYEIVANNTMSDDSSFDTWGSQLTEAVWSFEYAFSYRTNAATVESDQRKVEVYD